MNFSLSILRFLLLLGALQGFIFVIFPFLTKKRIDRSIIFLNGTVLFISANNFQAWLKGSDYAFTEYILKNLEIPWYMMIVPCFWLFLIHYLKIEEKVRTYLMLSIGIFLVEISIRFGLILYNYPSSNNGIVQNYTKLEEIFNAIYSIFLFGAAIKILFFKVDLHGHTNEYGNLKWLKQFMRIGGIVILFWLMAILLNISTKNQYFAYSYYPLQFSSSLLIYWIGYQGLVRYNLKQDRISLRNKITGNHFYIKIEERTDDIEKVKQRRAFEDVESYLFSFNRYLDPTLSLDVLASEVKMSMNELSRLINIYSNHNFSDYINQYRVQQAKKLLIDNDYNQYTIIAIGLECGFNSKSTFYSAFKKFSGQTPTAYRQHYQGK